MRPLGVAVLALATVLAGCLAAPASLEPAALPVDPAAFVQEGPFSRPLVPGALPALPVEVADIPSFDGTVLRVGVYRPDTAERVPVILQVSPYFGAGEGPVDAITDVRMAKFLVENFVPHGYAVAFMPLRGTGDSAGCFDFGGPKEQGDADAVVTWLAEQPWSNGHVGMTGKSYDGSPQWAVAALGNPALKTIVPLSGLTGIKTMHFVNGSAESRTAILWLLYASSSVQGEGRSQENLGSSVLCADTAQALAAAGTGVLTGDPTMGGASDYWLVRDYGPAALEQYQGSLFLVHGLQDWNVHPDIAFPLFTQFPGPKKALLGQWAHDYPDRPEANPHATRWDFAEQLLRWFDRELKGLDRDTGPAVEVEDNQGVWRNEATWPPADAAPLELRLGPGTLGPEAGPAGEVLLANPAGLLAPSPAWGPGVPFLGGGLPEPVSDATTQAGVAEVWFTGEPLAADLRLSGLPQVPLTVVPMAEGGHAAAELYALADGAEPVLVGHGHIDFRFPEGGDAPQPVVPGMPLVVRLQLFPLDALVPAGHTLALRITQDADPTYLPSPLAGPFTLRFGGDAESLLRLPVIARSAADLAGGWPLGPAAAETSDGRFDFAARP